MIGFDRRSRLVQRARAMNERWKVIISYTPEHMVDDIYNIEELQELQDIVEHGPDWNLIDAITITLA